jgi:hypothetical protein
MSNNPTDSNPIDLSRLNREIGNLRSWFGHLNADKQDKYSPQMDYINQSIEKILNNHPITQDHAKWTQNKANETTVAVSALYNKVIPLLAEFKGLGGTLKRVAVDEELKSVLEGIRKREARKRVNYRTKL